MPVYNAQKYLHTAINSVINQSYKEWELIIINDGSTDNSETIISEYQDSRIHLAQTKKNSGVSAARNVGLNIAKGKYIVFLDADDELPINSIDNRLQLLQNNPEARFCDGFVAIYDEGLNHKLKVWQPDFIGNPLKDLLSLGGKSFFGVTWMIKRDLQNTIFFKEGLSHGEDLLYFIEESILGGSYVFCQEVTYKVRRGHMSAMSNLNKLAEGYSAISSSLEKIEGIKSKDLKVFKRKSRLIMFKSYLRNGQIRSALKQYL